MSNDLSPSLREGKQPVGQLNRRQFVQGLSALLAGGTLAACNGVREETQQGADRWPTPTPARVMASPRPVTPEAVTSPQEGELGLEQFMLLSTVLTGFANLDPILGRVYWQSLRSNQTEVTLAKLYEQAGFQGVTPPQALDDRIFEQESTRALADKIIEYWYTGVYEEDGEQIVATTVDALAWQALHFTKPPTICGPYPGFWQGRPQVEPIPPIHEVSLPQEESNSTN